MPLPNLCNQLVVNENPLNPSILELETYALPTAASNLAPPDPHVSAGVETSSSTSASAHRKRLPDLV